MKTYFRYVKGEGNYFSVSTMNWREIILKSVQSRSRSLTSVMLHALCTSVR